MRTSARAHYLKGQWLRSIEYDVEQSSVLFSKRRVQLCDTVFCNLCDYQQQALHRGVLVVTVCNQHVTLTHVRDKQRRAAQSCLLFFHRFIGCVRTFAQFPSLSYSKASRLLTLIYALSLSILGKGREGWLFDAWAVIVCTCQPVHISTNERTVRDQKTTGTQSQ